MKRFALIGHPLAGSLSPALFYKAYSGKWGYDLIDDADFGSAWGRFLTGYDAVNITAPFKEKAFGMAAQADEGARAAGAANIAVKTPEGIKAYNSDYLAVLKILRSRGLGKGCAAVIAGCGGAGRAAFAAAEALQMRAMVCNRSPKRLRSVSGADISTLSLEELPRLAADADILIYTLPVSTEGLKSRIILEANYKSPSLEKSALAEYIPGSEWLLEQAREGYALMTGEKPAL